MRGRHNCARCGRWRHNVDFRPVQWLWGKVTRISAECNSCYWGESPQGDYIPIPHSLRTDITVEPDEPIVLTPRKYYDLPTPHEREERTRARAGLNDTKAHLFGNKNRRRTETDAQFKAKERERKRKGRAEGKYK